MPLPTNQLPISFRFQIKSGEIYASIHQKDGMVVFKDNPEKYNTPEMFLKMQDDITLVMALHKQIAKKEEDITLNPAVSSEITHSFTFFYQIIL